MTRTSFVLSDNMRDQIMELVDEGMYASQSEFIRAAIRDKLKEVSYDG